MSSRLKNNHSFLANLKANQGSAPNISQNSLSCSTSCLSRYFFLSFVDLHSIAIVLTLLLTIKSGPGYFIEPEPALLIQPSPLLQNKCNNSLSALEPLDFEDILTT